MSTRWPAFSLFQSAFSLQARLLSVLVLGSSAALAACGNSDTDSPGESQPPGSGQGGSSGMAGSSQAGAGQGGGLAGSPGQGMGGKAAAGTAGAEQGGGQAGMGGSAGQAGSSSAGQAGSGGAGSGGQAGAGGQAEAGAGGQSGQAGSTDQDKYKTDPATAAIPPGPPADAAPDGNQPVIHAISLLFLGDTDRKGLATDLAWQSYGFDLDGLSSDVNNSYHCKPAQGANKKNVMVNGPGGIDNSFGKNIVSIISGVASDPSAKFTQSIRDGDFSFVLRMDKLGAQANYTNLDTQLFAVQGSEGGDGKLIAPTDKELADGTYVWHPLPELLKGDGSSKQDFPTSYVKGNTIVSGTTRRDVSFILSLQGVKIELLLHQTQCSTQLSADHKTSTNGNLGGVLNTQEFVQSFKQVAGSLSSSLCSGSTFDSIATQIEQASDIMADGTQDPTKTCDGISVGIGFETVSAQLGDPAPPTTNPESCP